MITVSFTAYHNDYNQHDCSEQFSSLKELQDWLFNKCRNGVRGLHFTDPDIGDASKLNYSCINSYDSSTDTDYWVHTISTYGGIIYSDGYNTNGIKHWSEPAKQFLRDCRARLNNPASAYNFI